MLIPAGKPEDVEAVAVFGLVNETLNRPPWAGHGKRLNLRPDGVPIALQPQRLIRDVDAALQLQ